MGSTKYQAFNLCQLWWRSMTVLFLLPLAELKGFFFQKEWNGANWIGGFNQNKRYNILGILGTTYFDEFMHVFQNEWPNKLLIHPGKLTWNPTMKVWKMIFLFNWFIFSFKMLIFRGVICMRSSPLKHPQDFHQNLNLCTASILSLNIGIC